MKGHWVLQINSQIEVLGENNLSCTTQRLEKNSWQYTNLNPDRIPSPLENHPTKSHPLNSTRKSLPQ
jgi:hypothetical protein